MITKRTKTIGITGLITLLVSISILVGFWYIVAISKEKLQERVVAHAEIMAHRTQLATLVDLVTETGDDRERIASYVLTDDSVISFLSLIEETARGLALDVTTKSLAVNAIEGNNAFESLSLSIEVLGPLDAVSDMISLAELLPYQVTIRRVSLDSMYDSETLRMLWKGVLDIEVTKYTDL